MKINVFVHLLLPRYKEALHKENLTEHYRTLHKGDLSMDLEDILRILDKLDDVVLVPTVTGPPLENVCSPERAAELARIANDEMAELVLKYHDRFPAAVGWLPMNNMEAALAETDRVIKDLKLKGVQIYTPINEKCLDSPEFWPLYAKMEQYDLPIWIHPSRGIDYPDYRTEKTSKYRIYTALGWIYETSTAMSRLVASGVLEKYPNLKFITHHCGAMIPITASRVARLAGGGIYGEKEAITKPPINYFKKFYVDSLSAGGTPGQMCSYAYYGAEHMLMGTDAPSEEGTRNMIESIERMSISDAEKKLIFEGNARRLLHLDLT